MSRSSAPVFTLLLLLLLLLFQVDSTTAESPDSSCSVQSCAALNVGILQEYVNSLNLSHSINDHLTLDSNSTELSPFGSLPDDWIRLKLLENKQPEGTPLRENLLRLSRLMLAAYFLSEDQQGDWKIQPETIDLYGENDSTTAPETESKDQQANSVTLSSTVQKESTWINASLEDVATTAASTTTTYNNEDHLSGENFTGNESTTTSYYYDSTATNFNQTFSTLTADNETNGNKSNETFTADDNEDESFQSIATTETSEIFFTSLLPTSEEIILDNSTVLTSSEASNEAIREQSKEDFRQQQLRDKENQNANKNNSDLAFSDESDNRAENISNENLNKSVDLTSVENSIKNQNSNEGINNSSIENSSEQYSTKESENEGEKKSELALSDEAGNHNHNVSSEDESKSIVLTSVENSDENKNSKEDKNKSSIENVVLEQYPTKNNQNESEKDKNLSLSVEADNHNQSVSEDNANISIILTSVENSSKNKNLREVKNKNNDTLATSSEEDISFEFNSTKSMEEFFASENSSDQQNNSTKSTLEDNFDNEEDDIVKKFFEQEEVIDQADAPKSNDTIKNDLEIIENSTKDNNETSQEASSTESSEVSSDFPNITDEPLDVTSPMVEENSTFSSEIFDSTTEESYNTSPSNDIPNTQEILMSTTEIPENISLDSLESLESHEIEAIADISSESNSTSLVVEKNDDNPTTTLAQLILERYSTEITPSVYSNEITTSSPANGTEDRSTKYHDITTEDTTILPSSLENTTDKVSEQDYTTTSETDENRTTNQVDNFFLSLTTERTDQDDSSYTTEDVLSQQDSSYEISSPSTRRRRNLVLTFKHDPMDDDDRRDSSLINVLKRPETPISQNIKDNSLKLKIEAFDPRIAKSLRNQWQEKDEIVAVTSAEMNKRKSRKHAGAKLENVERQYRTFFGSQPRRTQFAEKRRLQDEKNEEKEEV